MDSSNLIADVLSAYTDRLVKRRQTTSNYLKLFPDDEELPAMLILIEQLKDVLKPVHPSRPFKEDLYRSLIIVAHQQKAEQKVLTKKRLNIQDTWRISALVGTCLTVAGLVFVYIRREHLGWDIQFNYGNIRSFNSK